MKIGDLVRTNASGKLYLEFHPLGFGYVTKICSSKIVYVTWYSTGTTRPINVIWLENLEATSNHD